MHYALQIAFGLLLAAPAAEPCCCDGPPPGPCEPGCQWVQVDGCKEVCREVCKTVPDVKKVRKVVYCAKDSPFCLRGCGTKAADACGCGGTCARCRGVFGRKILVKTEITCDEPTVKCVTEKVVEQVPCKVWRKVPCPAAAGR